MKTYWFGIVAAVGMFVSFYLCFTEKDYHRYIPPVVIVTGVAMMIHFFCLYQWLTTK